MLLTEAANRLGLDTGKLLHFGIGTNNDNSTQRYRMFQIKPVMFKANTICRIPKGRLYTRGEGLRRNNTSSLKKMHLRVIKTDGFERKKTSIYSICVSTWWPCCIEAFLPICKES